MKKRPNKSLQLKIIEMMNLKLYIWFQFQYIIYILHTRHTNVANQ